MRNVAMFIALAATLVAACRKEPIETYNEEIPTISWNWGSPQELRSLCVYVGCEQDPTTVKEIGELYHNSLRIMIDYKSSLKFLKHDINSASGLYPSNSDIALLIQKLKADSDYCDFSRLKGTVDYCLKKGKAICVDNHECAGYFAYTNGENENQDLSLFGDANKQLLLKELEMQEARFLQKNYAKEVRNGNICLELLNEPKDTRWENIQQYLAKSIAQEYPELYLAIRPDQSYSSNCLRSTWLNPQDYKDIKHVTFVNFWFYEMPDSGASPVDFAIQYNTFVKYRSGEKVTFNVFGGKCVGYYSGREYTISKESLEGEFKYCSNWARNNGEKIFFAELGCVRYADPQGQYFLSCLKLKEKYNIGIALFEVGAKYFFNYDGDVPFYMNDHKWAGFKYLQMSPEEIKNQL